MKTMKLMIAVLVQLAVSSFYIPSVNAAGTVCSNETISSGTFSWVIVQRGTFCTLDGSVIVEEDVTAVRLQREWDIWGSKLRDSGNRC